MDLVVLHLVDLQAWVQLTGPIPAEIGAMPILKWLDISVNKLNGTIPSTFR